MHSIFKLVIVGVYFYTDLMVDNVNQISFFCFSISLKLENYLEIKVPGTGSKHLMCPLYWSWPRGLDLAVLLFSH